MQNTETGRTNRQCAANAITIGERVAEATPERQDMVSRRRHRQA
jgi:hypothetical protein